jgi:(2Fe-2S) ferredoxin
MNKTTHEQLYFKRHVFFCLNERQEGQACCARQEAKQAFEHCKKTIKEAGLSGQGSIRINKAGCLDRCAGAPVLVVYPEGVWYTYVDNHDIDEIIESHLKKGKVVDRLLMPADVGY